MLEINTKTLEKFYYKDRLSMQEITDKFGRSLNCIRYYMSKYGLIRRDKSEASYIKCNKEDPFSVKNDLTKEEEKLKLAGLMLYWGEGRKKTGRIDISNSDPGIIKIFLRFLREICGVKEEKLAVSLQMFDDQDEAELIRFWGKITGISRERFHKPYKRKGKTGTYIRRSPFGTVLVGLDNIKLKKIILDWLEEYKTKFSLTAGVAQR